jgi:hypothetical protein
MGYITYMTNTQKENIVYDSPSGTHVVINTYGKDGRLHNWEWVIREDELLDYTEWEWKDMKYVTDEQIKACEFPAGITGFYIPSDLDY